MGGDLSNHDLDIPAGDNNVRFDAIGIISQPAKLMTFEPHGTTQASIRWEQPKRTSRPWWL